jgi:hypothetical protein
VHAQKTKQYDEEVAMPFQDQSVELIERLEKLMHPLSERGHGPDHDRLRELYLAYLEQCIGDPLEQARRAVLHELLSSYVQAVQEPPEATPQAIIYARNAIGALATFICRLEEQNYVAAAGSLEAASQAFQEVQKCLATSTPRLSSVFIQ